MNTTPEKLRLTGQRQGKLTIIGLAEPIRHPSGQLSKRWLCRCECGNEKVIPDRSFRKGVRSCGCLISEAARMKATHDMTKSVENRIWRSMKNRCLNKACEAFPSYGGRGITVCDSWLKFENFFSDMGERPSRKHSIDRIDVNGNYEPGNCRWATKEEQANNTRSNHFIEFNGEKLTLAQWERKLGLPRDILKQRITNYGWSIEKALTTPRINSRYEHKAN